MACRKGCGGGRTVSPTTAALAELDTNLVLIEYIGSQTQKRRLRSKANPREQYVFGGEIVRFRAYKADVAWLTSMASEFKIVNEAVIAVAQDVAETVPVLVSAQRPPTIDEVRETAIADMPLDVLNLDHITLAALKKHYKTVSELRVVGRSGWMTIKGIGATRADAIAEAIDAL